MNILNKKAIICFLAFTLSPLSVWGAVSVTLPDQKGGGALYIEKNKHNRHHPGWKRQHRNPHGWRHRDRGERVCRGVTREQCKKKCRWDNFYQRERCRTYCHPVREHRCWYRNR